jgi:Sulfotransferase family
VEAGVDVADVKAPSVTSVKLPCGLTVRFHQGEKPAGYAMTESAQRPIRTTGQFENTVNEARDSGPFAPPVVINEVGAWTHMAAHAVQMGMREIDVWQNPRTNDALTDYRRYLYAPVEKIGAIPNYKCGYSSLKLVFGQLSTADLPIDGPEIRRDGIMSMSQLPCDFLFSIVREPVDRFISFYVDKFMRAPTHGNYAQWRVPHEILLGKNFGPDAVLWLIEKTPPAFADLHWKSITSSIYHGGRALPHRVYDLASVPALAAELSERLKRNIAIRRVNVTDHIDHKDIHDRVLRSKEIFERAYAADMALVAEIKARGGVADPAELRTSPGASAIAPAEPVAAAS